MVKKKDKKLKNLEETLDELKERFGEGAIMKLDTMKPASCDVISTGVLSLDLVLGVMGVPRGRIIEIYGAESSGKTTLALSILAQAQKDGGVGAFIDVEHALDPEYAKKIGVNVEDLLISQPDSAEQALQIVESLVRSGEIDVIVVDSVAALAPKIEVEGEIGDQFIGTQARLMSQALRKLSSIVSKTRTLVIFLNQIRMKIGVMFGNPETTSGGLALKFYSSVRIELRRSAQIKKGEDIVGSRIVAKIVKNKVAPPFKKAEFDIYYNEGISKIADLLNLGQKYNIIQKSGTYFQYGNKKIGQNVEQAKKFFAENSELEKEIREKIIEKAKEEGF
ncbi:MAG: recombinase RecA [Minisyncoccia bacterium]